MTKHSGLRASDRFRVLFDNSSDPHFIFMDGGITDVNDATVRILGYPNREHVLKLHPAVLSPKYQPDGSLSSEKSARMDAIALERGSHRFEWLHRKADGSEFPVEVVVNAVEIDGRPAFVAIWHDLTEIKRRESELAELGRRLAEKNEELASVNGRMRSDLAAAVQAQAALLPPASIDFPGCTVEWAYRPSSELGGDLLNVFRVNESLVGLYVLDVTGHGAASALLSVTASHFLSSLNDGEHHDVAPCGPATMAKRLNRYFSKARLDSRFFTLIYAVFDVTTGELRYVTAGHPPAILVPLQGEPRLLQSDGIPIGLLENADYVHETVRLSPGDRVYLFSDGLYEERRLDGEEYGYERLCHFFLGMKGLPPKEAARRAVVEIAEWAHPKALADDVSLIVLELPKIPDASGGEALGLPD